MYKRQGIHIKKNGKLPSNESIAEVVKKCKSNSVIGIILACVSPEIIESAINEMKSLKIPFGYKANLWKEEEPVPVHKFALPTDEIGANPVETMGTRNDYTGNKYLEFSKKMISKGATILGAVKQNHSTYVKFLSLRINYLFVLLKT